MLFSLVLSLFACEDPTVGPVPAPDEAGIRLASGVYELQIYGVEALSCDGADARGLVGESIAVGVHVARDGAAVVSMEGFELVGDMAGGNLYVEGSLAYDDEPSAPPREENDDEIDVDYPSEGEGGGSGAEPGDDGEERPDRDERPVEGFAALDARAVDSHLASGRLSMQMDGCGMDLQVALVFLGEEGDDPVVVVEGETEDVDDAPPQDERE